MSRPAELAEELRTKAHMIYMGEKITFGSEVALMQEAADLLEKLAKKPPSTSGDKS